MHGCRYNPKPLLLYPRHSCRRSLGNEGLETGRVSTEEIALLLSILVEHERRHRSDSDFLGDFGLRIDIDLVELNALRGRGHLLENGGDGLAGTTPGCPEVDHDRLSAVDDGLEFVVGGDGGDSHGEWYVNGVRRRRIGRKVRMWWKGKRFA